ncbi:MAG: hypothetical protein WBW33_12255 [Bryobacteraceae bacterium]
MKFLVKRVRRFGVPGAISAVVLLSSAAFAQTLEENMASQAKLHIVPGKKLHAKGPNYEFCEVAPFVGTSPQNAVANFYNPTGIDHCTPEQFAEIVKNKAQIIKETGALDVFLNPSRHWTWDEFWVYEVGDERKFGPVKMAWMGVVPVEAMKAAVGQGHYHPGQIHRNNAYLYKKGTQVYLLDMGDGKVLVMQSWTNFVYKGETEKNLKDLGSQFKELPQGWTFRTKVLDKDLKVSPPAPAHLAYVTQDEFQNTYQGCGYDTACTYVP